MILLVRVRVRVYSAARDQVCAESERRSLAAWAWLAKEHVAAGCGAQVAAGACGYGPVRGTAQLYRLCAPSSARAPLPRRILVRPGGAGGCLGGVDFLVRGRL